MSGLKPPQAQMCGHCFGIGYDASGYACTCAEPASVAKVGRRIPKHPQPPRPERWRDYLKDLARAMLLVIAVMFISALTLSLILKPATHVIDCSMAEPHPDHKAAFQAECKKNWTSV